MADIYLDDKDDNKVNKGMENYIEMVSSLAYYHGGLERTTNDGEWTEQELRDNIYDDVKAVFKQLDIERKYKHRAVKSRDLLNCNYMSECINNQIDDVIELYNSERDKHINDDEQLFAIHYFDRFVEKLTHKMLKENEVH